MFHSLGASFLSQYTTISLCHGSAAGPFFGWLAMLPVNRRLGWLQSFGISLRRQQQRQQQLLLHDPPAQTSFRFLSSFSTILFHLHRKRNQPIPIQMGWFLVPSKSCSLLLLPPPPASSSSLLLALLLSNSPVVWSWARVPLVYTEKVYPPPREGFLVIFSC